MDGAGNVTDEDIVAARRQGIDVWTDHAARDGEIAGEVTKGNSGGVNEEFDEGVIVVIVVIVDDGSTGTDVFAETGGDFEDLRLCKRGLRKANCLWGVFANRELCYEGEGKMLGGAG